MSALVHDSPDRAVTAIEPLTGSDNYATWKRLMTSYLKARQVWDVVSGDLRRPDCLFKYAKPITADIHPLVEPPRWGVRQRAIEARLEVEVQAIHVADLRRLATSGMNSKNGTGEWSSPRSVSYLRSFVKPLASAAAVPANLSIGLDRNTLVVDAIQNDKDPVNPTTIGNRLSNAEQTVRRKEAPTPLQAASGPSVHTVQQTAKKCNYSVQDHALKAERSVSGSPRSNLQMIPSSQLEDRQGPPTSKTEDQYREGEGDDPLYPRTATPVDPGLGRHQPHLLGPELLQQSAGPPRDVGHGGRSSGSRRIGTVKLMLRGKFNQPLGLKNVYFAPRVGMNLISAEAVARPLLGGGAPAERLCATPRTNRGDRLPRGGGST
ncbi:hypothetical protein AAWM_11184, partial [Aspergillus awamori]